MGAANPAAPTADYKPAHVNEAGHGSPRRRGHRRGDQILQNNSSKPVSGPSAQHARDERDQVIATGLDDLIREAKKASRKPRRSEDDDDPPLVGAPAGA